MYTNKICVTVSNERTSFGYFKSHALQQSSVITLCKVQR